MRNEPIIKFSLLHNIILFLLLCVLSSCHIFQEKNAPYSFFVAGHAYGSPLRKAPGLHPPFVADFDSIKARANMEFGVLAGDIVYYSRDSFWDRVDQELSFLEMPVYFAAGNHDGGNKPVYENRYGKTFYSFTKGRDLFLILNPGLGGWNIWNDQLDFVKAQLEDTKKYQHVFVIFHQLLWTDPVKKYPSPTPNSFVGRAPTINFWSEVMPLFYDTELPVYLFAGDAGANLRVSSFYLNKVQNVHMLATGMGNGLKDNYLIIDVDEAQEVQISLRWLQGDKTEVLDLEEKVHLIYPF